MKVLAAVSLGIIIAAIAARADPLSNDPLLAFVNEESARIFEEGDRIKGESGRLRSEGNRLGQEATRLRVDAAGRDHLWKLAKEARGLHEYVGYNRSQLRMRSDVVLLNSDAKQLRVEAVRLDHEAVRLWKLSAAVDPAAMKALLDRLRQCCSTQASLSLLRDHIIKMAAAARVSYIPRNPS
jgi:hypothetical protein